MQKEKTKEFSPDDVITALLFFLPNEFSNDPEKIHTTLRRLQQEEKYNELLGPFEFIDYPRFPYSPILGRILNRLQESRLLSSRNPDYRVYQVKPTSKEAIESYFLAEGKVLHQQIDKLKEIASEFKKELGNVEP